MWLALLLGPSLLPAQDTNGPYTETWLGKTGNAVGIAGYPAGGGQYLYVAGSDGLVRPLVIQAPSWQWAWRQPITQQHEGIVGLAAYHHPGDGRHHSSRVETALSTHSKSGLRQDGSGPGVPRS